MERMEVEPSSPGPGGALRRSNSAPLLLPPTPRGATGATPPGEDPPPATPGTQRSRRSSASLCSGARDAGAVRTPCAWPPPRVSTSPSPSLETLKRKGGLDIDSPPKKLFVAGVPITPPAP